MISQNFKGALCLLNCIANKTRFEEDATPLGCNFHGILVVFLLKVSGWEIQAWLYSVTFAKCIHYSTFSDLMKIQSGTQDLDSLPIIYHPLNFPWIAFQTNFGQRLNFSSEISVGNEWNSRLLARGRAHARDSVTDLTNIRARKSDCAQWPMLHAFPRNFGEGYWLMSPTSVIIAINICQVIETLSASNPRFTVNFGLIYIRIPRFELKHIRVCVVKRNGCIKHLMTACISKKCSIHLNFQTALKSPTSPDAKRNQNLGQNFRESGTIFPGLMFAIVHFKLHSP